MDFILTSHNTLSIVFTVKHIPNNRPRHFSCQLQVILTSKLLNPPSVPSDNSICLWSAWWTSTGLERTRGMSSRAVSVCGGWWNRTIVQRRLAPGWVSSQSHQKLLSTEPSASGPAHYYMRGGTCDLFNYSALHFYPTIQNETRELIASKIHLYNLPQAHKLSNFEAGVDELQTPADPFHSRATSLRGVGNKTELGCSLCSGGREKKVHLLSCEPSNM